MNIPSRQTEADGLAQRFLCLAEELIARTTDERGAHWFRAAMRDSETRSGANGLGPALGLAPRRLGKADLALTEADRVRISALRPGLDLTGWSVDQLARVALILSAHRGDDEGFAQDLETFCATAEINELIAVYRGFPVFPGARLIERRAREAVRSAIRPVFEALAHRNPYPAENFDADAWNQMVLKALFIGSELWPIHGLDRRANPHLAAMLVAYAQERRAAKRHVSHELWRCVAPFAENEALDAMADALQQGTDRDRLAIALALRTHSLHGRGRLADETRALQQRIDAEKLDWKSLAELDA